MQKDLLLLVVLMLANCHSPMSEFEETNNSLKETSTHFEKREEQIIEEFRESQRLYSEDYNKAMKLKSLSDEVCEYIADLKLVIILCTEYNLKPETFNSKEDIQEYITNSELYKKHGDSTYDELLFLTKVEHKDNYDIPSQILIGNPKSPYNKDKKWSALELKNRLSAYNYSIQQLVSKRDSLHDNLEDVFSLNKSIQINPEKTESWEMANFYHLPLAAVVTNLSKIQADLKNTEADVLKYMLDKQKEKNK